MDRQEYMIEKNSSIKTTLIEYISSAYLVKSSCHHT